MKQASSKIEIHQSNLWPIPFYETVIRKFKIHPTRVSFNEDLSGYLYGLKEKNKDGRIKSNRGGGWQSELLNWEDKELLPLSKEIINVVNNINLNDKFKICQMWANINLPGSYNVMHRHAYSLLSGTYYVKTPKNSGEIQFRCPTEGVLMHQWWSDKLKGDYYNFKPEDGLLLLWPSFVDHWVTPNNSDDDRISISFDLRI